MKTVIDLVCFCGEKAQESVSGRINFTTYSKNKFCAEIGLEYTSLSKRQKEEVRFAMIDLYNTAVSSRVAREKSGDREHYNNRILSI